MEEDNWETTWKELCKELDEENAMLSGENTELAVKVLRLQARVKALEEGMREVNRVYFASKDDANMRHGETVEGI